MEFKFISHNLPDNQTYICKMPVTFGKNIPIQNISASMQKEEIKKPDGVPQYRQSLVNFMKQKSKFQERMLFREILYTIKKKETNNQESFFQAKKLGVQQMAETGKYVALVKDGNRMMLLPVDDWLQFSKIKGNNTDEFAMDKIDEQLKMLMKGGKQKQNKKKNDEKDNTEKNKENEKEVEALDKPKKKLKKKDENDNALYFDFADEEENDDAQFFQDFNDNEEKQQKIKKIRNVQSFVKNQTVVEPQSKKIAGQPQQDKFKAQLIESSSSSSINELSSDDDSII